MGLLKNESASSHLTQFLENISIEVMPRTAEKIENFQDILPQNTRIYIAHIDGTPLDDMVNTAKRLRNEGYEIMPHFPARSIIDKADLEHWIKRYQEEADVSQALLLAGGISHSRGVFRDSMQLLKTGLFDKYGFTDLHVAGHPEVNFDIDPKGGTQEADAALRWKQDFANNSDAKMALTTQFCFESAPVIQWAERIKAMGIDLPIHIGVAGPAKLQTMIKFALACGVGPSLRVLQKRAKDVTKLLLPHEPTQILSELAEYKANNPQFDIDTVHFFPLGGIKTSAEWLMTHREPAPSLVQ